MGLSFKEIDEHIIAWSANLANPRSYEYRAKWPRFLFRHEPLDNAIKIIQSGQLLSRAHAEKIEHLDIAPANVIDARHDGHEFSRLYFRPRNPTQYHVEGIRKASDLYQGDVNAHAPVLIMFMFSARSVLALPNTHFSNGNMQSQNTDFDSSFDFFHSIPFSHVYHEGPYEIHSIEGEQILKARCAEVLPVSPLLLDEHLSAIMCRSEAERQTLLNLSGDISPQLRKKIIVVNEVGIFQSQFSYVKSINFSSNGIKISLNARKDSARVLVRLEVHDEQRDKLWTRVKDTSVDPAKMLSLSKDVENGKYLVSIWIDGHLAYKAYSIVDDQPF